MHTHESGEESQGHLYNCGIWCAQTGFIADLVQISRACVRNLVLRELHVGKSLKEIYAMVVTNAGTLNSTASTGVQWFRVPIPAFPNATAVYMCLQM